MASKKCSLPESPPDQDHNRTETQRDSSQKQNRTSIGVLCGRRCGGGIVPALRAALCPSVNMGSGEEQKQPEDSTEACSSSEDH